MRLSRLQRWTTDRGVPRVWSLPHSRGDAMSDRTIAARRLSLAEREQAPNSDGDHGGWTDPPPITGGDLCAVEQLRFEVADATDVARTAAGQLRALDEWLRHLPGRCGRARLAVPGIPAAVASLRDVHLELARVGDLLGALSRLEAEVDASCPPAHDGGPETLRGAESSLMRDADDRLDPALLPTEALVSALSRGARGDYAHEAAVDLLAGFGCPSGFWLRRSDFLDNCIEAWLSAAPDDTTRARVPMVNARIDGAALADLLDGHHIEGAGGELRILHLVAGLLGHLTGRPLSEQLLGLDEDTTVLVLRAVAHVGGWHERGRTFVFTEQDSAAKASPYVAAGVRRG